MKIPLYKQIAVVPGVPIDGDFSVTPPARGLVCSTFLKWVGGKRRLLPSLLPLLPRGRRLIEPFVGAGSVFLATNFDEYVLGDTNNVLIDTYRRLQSGPTELVARASSFFSSENLPAERYMLLRSMFNHPATSDLDRASLFIYLNKFGFNGLYRVNKKGAMNVPCAHHKKVPAFPAKAMHLASAKLSFATLLCADFLETMHCATDGDVVYCDPPYLNAEGASKCFTSYAKEEFGLAKHRQLVESARELSRKGIPVVISNHDTPETRQLYSGAELHSFTAYRSMSAKSSSRARANELVAIFKS